MVRNGQRRYPGALANPFVVRQELEPQLVVEDTQRAVTIMHDSLRHDRLNLLGHHAHVSAVAAIVAEPIVAKAVRQVAEQNDIVLEPDIRAPAATTAATAATAEAAAATAAEAAAATAAEAAATTTAEAAATTTAEAAATTAAKAGAAPRSVVTGDPA